MQTSIFKENETFKWLGLHPACFNGQNTFIFGVNQNDQIVSKKFKIIDGLSKPLRISEQKPGVKPYEISLSQDGYVAVYHVVSQTNTAVGLSISLDKVALTDSFDSDQANFDDMARDEPQLHYQRNQKGKVKQTRYSIVKEEFP